MVAMSAPAPRPLSLGDVYADHAARVGGWAARLAGPHLDPEDLVHDVFLIVRDKLADFRGDAKLTTWLYRITLNVVRDRRRRERRHWLRRLLFGAQASHAEVRTPYDSSAQREATEQIYTALDALPERDRTLLVLFELEGLSGEAIAEILDVREATVWVQLHRARAKLRAQLEARHPELVTPVRRTT
jgi:RNA polymerase sigma-70 factor (ECF subfamily)